MKSSYIQIFCYQVRGYGVANPYRLRPYLGARVALDHIFTSLLFMYNPHDSPLQVLYRFFLWCISFPNHFCYVSRLSHRIIITNRIIILHLQLPKVFLTYL